MKFILHFSAALFLLLPAALHAADAPTKPNVVIFLVDDMGWGDLGCYGNKIIQSPSLDKFAREAMRFTQAYAACPVCSPSRAAIQTGRTPYRNGVYTWIPAGREMHLRSSELTIATVLQDAGYATCHSGKWHLNGKFNSPEQPQPNDHGYDWWFATQNNAHPSHKDPENFVRNGKPAGNLAGYSGQLVVSEAIDFLKHHRDPKKPFLLNVWTHETHQPIEADPKFQAIYPKFDESHRQYYGDATQMDTAFGALMEALEESGEADNTIVFFTADNGPEGDGKTKRNCGSTGGLRGRKRWLYEGGIREPFMVRWPGHIEPGSTCDQPVIGSDIFTTVCEVTGLKPPADRIIDGKSIVPAFHGQPIERKVPLFWRWDGAPGGLHIALRDGDWKLLANKAMDKFELYNLKDDFKETTDLAAKEPERVKQMHKTMASLVDEMAVGAPVWDKGKPKEETPAKRRGKKASDDTRPTKTLSSENGANSADAEFTSEIRTYKNVGDRELKLLIEKPAGWKASDKRPAIVFFFGGGWVGGRTGQFQAQSEYFATRGMVGVRVEYRVVPKGDNSPPIVCCNDAKSAMRWVRSHAAELGIDPQRIAASGGSAGGHLAAFTSMVDGVDDPADDLKVSPRGNALVLFNPVFDNGPENGWGTARVGNRFKEFSPAHNITSQSPPAIVFLGSKDRRIPVSVLERFKAKMTKAGVRCDAHVYDGQPHGFFNKEPYKTTTLIAAVKFLASLGWLEGEPTLTKAAIAPNAPVPEK